MQHVDVELSSSINSHLTRRKVAIRSVSALDCWCSVCKAHHTPHNERGPVRTERVMCPKLKLQVAALLLIGDAGSGVGLRLKGHLKRGGRDLRKEHRRYSLVAFVDEHKTSQLCVLCLSTLRPATAVRITNNGPRKVHVNGAKKCWNPLRPGRQCGYTVRGRDQQAAFAIALSALSILTSDSNTVLQAFRRFLRPDKVDQAIKLATPKSSRDKAAPGVSSEMHKE